MGVAGLFSFLRRRYPEIVEPCAQQGHEVADGESMCDNLYIDLNHIIHACTHPSWREVAHESELEQFMEVDVYLDRLVALARPTRLLLVAADGSAPVAKMNQQRGRRFYAAHLERQRADIEAQVRREMAAEMGPAGGADIPGLPAFDGNVITPGTAFMSRLSDHLKEFFCQKLGSDPEWSHLAVIFSDTSEPGEGEHKIMRFIRQQRTQPGYDPNTRHAIYGQDADLILLGLLSHEPHFCLLREAGTLDAVLEGARDGEEEGGEAIWSPVGQQPLELLRLSTLRDYLRCEFAEFCEPPQQAPGIASGGGAASYNYTPGPSSANIGTAVGPTSPGVGSSGGSGSGGAGEQGGLDAEKGEVDLITGERKKVHPSVARRRARQQQQGSAGAQPSSSGASTSGGGSSSAATHDFERILDDIVFCTFLAGNDFLPHVPSLDIYDRPSALETLLDKYKELLRSGSGGGGRRGYLTSGGRVDPDKLCWLFQRLGTEEEATFQQRELRKVREQRRKLQQEAGSAGSGGTGRAAAIWAGGGEWVSVGELGDGQSLDDMLAGMASGGNLDVPTAALWAGDPARLRRELLKRVRARMDDRAQAGMAADRVRLSISGYRGRYYQRCFGADVAGGPDLEKLVRRVCASFCRTLCWVMQYYVRGTPPVVTDAGVVALAEDGEEGAALDSNGSRSKAGGKVCDDYALYASWQTYYEWHYAPLASDLAKYAREALRGAAAAASRTGAPIPPFAQLLSVLPFSSMPSCLPAGLVAAAQDPTDGLAALHGTAGAEVFPEDVGALVDLSGKKWAHTAVVTLPFPDVGAICQFVREQLKEEDSYCMSEEERIRNSFAPALLFLPAFHPLAHRVSAGGGSSCSGSGCSSGAGAESAVAAASRAGAEGKGAAAGPGLADAADGQAADNPVGATILSLLSHNKHAASADSEQGGQLVEAVLCRLLDIAGQDVPPFSAGLLPGTEEGDRAVTLQAWSRRRLAEQRRQAERALASLRGGRGRGRGSGGRGRGSAGRGSAAFVEPAAGTRNSGIASSYLPPARGPALGCGQVHVPPVPPPPPFMNLLPPAPLPWQQPDLTDEDLAWQLQKQFDAEARAEAREAAAAAAAATQTAAAARQAVSIPPPPGFGAVSNDTGTSSFYTAHGASRGWWPAAALTKPDLGCSGTAVCASSSWGVSAAGDAAVDAATHGPASHAVAAAGIWPASSANSMPAAGPLEAEAGTSHPILGAEQEEWAPWLATPTMEEDARVPSAGVWEHPGTAGLAAAAVSPQYAPLDTALCMAASTPTPTELTGTAAAAAAAADSDDSAPGGQAQQGADDLERMLALLGVQ